MIADVIWIRVRMERISRCTHRVSARTGKMACREDLVVDLNGVTNDALQAMAEEDAGVPRCPRCERLQPEVIA